MVAFKQLISRLGPAQALQDLTDELGTSLRFDFAGIAVRHRGAKMFQVVGTVDRRQQNGGAKLARDFPAEGTVGEWVESTRLPFIGGEPRELVRFQQTMTDMLRHGFASNAVLPLDLGPDAFGVLYFLSVKPRSFGLDDVAVLSRVQRVIEPVTAAYLAATELHEGAPDETEMLDERGVVSALTMVEFERAYIERILAETGGVIEGPRGAAGVLGLKPSTLRSRMRRLGVSRGKS